MLRQLLLQVRHSPAEIFACLGIAGGLGLGEAGHDVRSHEDAAVVLFPPAPAAVVVLQVVQAIEAGVDLRLQIGRADHAGKVELLERLGNHQVGQEAGHGLLGATIRIGGEIAQRGEETPRDRRSDLEMQCVCGRIGVGRKVDGRVGRTIFRDHARGS